MGMSNSEIEIDVIAAVINAITMRDPEEGTHLLLNILMFIPFGALYPLMTPTEKDLESQRNSRFRTTAPVKYVSAVIFLGFAYSAVIESLQLVLSLGICDMADIFGNGVGTIIGACIGSIIRRLTRSS
jgi:glycopeptide antibiotics resistance protein